MSYHVPTRKQDEQVLDILDRMDGDGMRGEDAGKPYGRSRSSVAGMRKRIRDDLEAAGPCECRKKANRDGGMPRGWWRT